MKIVLKNIDSFECDPESYSPSAADDIAINITLKIGKEDGEGGDNFDLFICSPEWLSKNSWMPTWGRHMLLVRKYDLAQIITVINSRIEECTETDWLSSAHKLSRYFAWEFEDYSNINGA
jgi:hypothetical protein